jgi:beta-lactamase regulating signal transducer with metallopeptidase domain
MTVPSKRLLLLLFIGHRKYTYLLRERLRAMKSESMDTNNIQAWIHHGTQQSKERNGNLTSSMDKQNDETLLVVGCMIACFVLPIFL